jgi:hypothetical protein
VVLYAMRMLVFLNNLVMVLVSLPVHVNVAHFCSCVVLGNVLLFILVFVFMYVCVCGG